MAIPLSKVGDHIAIRSMLEKSDGRLRLLVEAAIPENILKEGMEPMERGSAEKAWLQITRHGKGVKVRTWVEAGGGLHKGSLLEGGIGGGSRRRQAFMYGRRLRILDGVNKSSNLGKQRVTHRGVAEPGGNGASEELTDASLLRRARPPSEALNGGARG